MLVFLALGNAKVLSFALGDAKVPNANDFASQLNIGLMFQIFEYVHLLWPKLHETLRNIEMCLAVRDLHSM